MNERERKRERRGQREKGEGKESIASLFSSYQRKKADSIMDMIFISKGIKPPAALQDKPEPVFSAEKMNNTELSQHLSQQFLSKLNQLEKLQYELTKQVRTRDS